jgi:enoyl-CoA hydratase
MEGGVKVETLEGCAMVTHTMHDQVAVLRMDDGKANALNSSSLASLDAALDATASARAIVLAGRPGFFSGGLDLKSLPLLPTDELIAVLGQFFRCVQRLAGSPIPIVAVVSGHAMAGGAVITLACDYAIGVRGPFRIGLTEVAIGLTLPEVVMELGRGKLVPNHWMRAMGHGEVYGPDQALAAGYLDEVVEAPEVEARALAKATALAALAGTAYQDTKRPLREKVLKASVDESLTPLLGSFRALLRV